MECPNTRLIGIKDNQAIRHRWDKNSVSQGSIDGRACHLDNLKDMAMEVHGMAHGCGVFKAQSNPLTMLDNQAFMVRIGKIINHPAIALHGTTKNNIELSINRTRTQGNRWFEVKILKAI